MTYHIVSKDEIKNIVTDPDNFNASFIINFVKKNGQQRKMICRRDVISHLSKRTTSKGLLYSAKDKGLMSVFDIEDMSYKMVSLDSINSAKINNSHYAVDFSITSV